jgi:hypothetical protein
MTPARSSPGDVALSRHEIDVANALMELFEALPWRRMPAAECHRSLPGFPFATRGAQRASLKTVEYVLCAMVRLGLAVSIHQPGKPPAYTSLAAAREYARNRQ